VRRPPQLALDYTCSGKYHGYRGQYAGSHCPGDGTCKSRADAKWMEEEMRHRFNLAYIAYVNEVVRPTWGGND
jgi:hypothetical protein